MKQEETGRPASPGRTLLPLGAMLLAAGPVFGQASAPEPVQVGQVTLKPVEVNGKGSRYQPEITSTVRTPTAPKDVPHKYSVVGEEAARVLLLFSRPGFESFFAEAGSPLDAPPAGPPDPAALVQLAARYECEVLAPPAH